jgi:PD-(D/E)XK nuclease superfamily
MMSAQPHSAEGAAGATAASPSPAQLAARIQIPRRLPPRYDGQPLQHLSHSSYNRFVLCPEDWRRRYMLGEKTAPSGSMFLGRQVDDAITLYYQHLLDHGERLCADQVKDAFWDGWKAAADAEREQLGIAWEIDLHEDSALKIGLDAVELTFSELIPHLGEPVAVQRKVEYALAPGLEWSVLCYLDLETRRPDAGALLPTVVDYKVKRTPLTQFKADHDFQPVVYLAGRWLEGDPVFRIGTCRTMAYPGQGFARLGAAFQGGVPSGARLTFPPCSISILLPSASLGFVRSWSAVMFPRTGRSTTGRMSRWRSPTATCGGSGSAAARHWARRGCMRATWRCSSSSAWRAVARCAGRRLSLTASRITWR